MSCRFSVIVPSFDRPGPLQECLRSLARQTYPRDCFEVIVVDDGSPVPVADLLGPATEGLCVQVMRIANSGPGCARNAGAAAARGQYLAFTDDDCRPHPSWLQELERCLERAPERLIGGRTVNALPHNRWSTASQQIVDMAYSFYNDSPESARFFASNNIALRADLFAGMSGFLGGSFRIASEDREFCDRWRHSGNELMFAPAAIVFHAHELNGVSFFLQHFRYGRGARIYHRVRRRRGSGQLRDDLGFYHGLAARVWGRLRAGNLRHLSHSMLPLILWQIANLCGFLFEGIRRDPSTRTP